MTDRETGKILLRIPKTLHLAARKRAREEGMSLNALLLSILSCGLSPWCCEHPAYDCPKEKPR